MATAHAGGGESVRRHGDELDAVSPEVESWKRFTKGSNTHKNTYAHTQNMHISQRRENEVWPKSSTVLPRYYVSMDQATDEPQPFQLQHSLHLHNVDMHGLVLHNTSPMQYDSTTKVEDGTCQSDGIRFKDVLKLQILNLKTLNSVNFLLSWSSSPARRLGHLQQCLVDVQRFLSKLTLVLELSPEIKFRSEMEKF